MLEGLYLHLVRSGFPLAVRDYQSALAALQLGYGVRDRSDLHWLCRALWARTEEEEIRLARLFLELPRPSLADIQQLCGPSGALASTQAASLDEPDPAEDAGTLASASAPRVEFVAASEPGIGLPRVVSPKTPPDAHIFSARPLLSLRSMVIAWRRFRRAQRLGPKVEIDVEATIAEQCRSGVLLGLTRIASRRNQACLVILVDASPSMATWRTMNRVIAQSLARSQLARTALYFFDNSPAHQLFEHDTLAGPVSLKSVLERHASSALLIVSDAGAVRGRHERDRVDQTARFLRATKETWPQVVWLNPMPRRRWRGTSADAIKRLRVVPMFELSDDGLTAAVDVIRGRLSW